MHRLVIATGRNRVCAPRTIASTRSIPESRSWLIWSIITMPLLTTILAGLTISTLLTLVVIPVLYSFTGRRRILAVA